MSIIVDGTPHIPLVLAAGDRMIEVLTARSDPTASAMKADVFVDFGIGDAIDGKDIIAIPARSIDEHYTGIIPHDLPSHDYPARRRELSSAIMKDAGSQGHSSLWLNFTDRPSWRLIKQTVDDYIGFLEGIRAYAEVVEREQPASHISDIVIGCGITTYNHPAHASGHRPCKSDLPHPHAEIV